MPVIVNPTLPNILTNGTIADATQVMGNLSSMISQINANAAENGANSSITSLSGLTTPLSVAQGGTGTNSIPQYAVPLGSALGLGWGSATPGAVGTVLASNGAAYPSFQAIGTLVSSSVITTSLGYTPVQQGTGVGQLNNLVKIGWNGSAIKVTIDTTDEGYLVTSTTNPTGGVTIPAPLNGQGGVFDGGNRVWSPVNYQPFTVNGIGYDVNNANVGVEGNTYTLSGRPGTWLCFSSNIAGAYLYRRIS